MWHALHLDATAPMPRPVCTYSALSSWATVGSITPRSSTANLSWHASPSREYRVAAPPLRSLLAVVVVRGEGGRCRMVVSICGDLLAKVIPPFSRPLTMLRHNTTATHANVPVWGGAPRRFPFSPGAESISLFRGDRHLHMELRCCACNTNSEVRHTLLGARRHVGTSALAITQATKDTMTRACMRDGAAPPKSAGSNILGTLDRHLLERIRLKVHMVSVGSAADGVTKRARHVRPCGWRPRAPRTWRHLRGIKLMAHAGASVGHGLQAPSSNTFWRNTSCHPIAISRTSTTAWTCDAFSQPTLHG